MAATITEQPHPSTYSHHGQAKHRNAFKTWPRGGCKREETDVKCSEKTTAPLLEMESHTARCKNQERLKSWIPKEGEITEGPVTRLIISRSPTESSSDGPSHHTGSGIEQKSKGNEGTVNRVNQGSAHSSSDDASLYTGFEEEQKTKEGTEPRVIISQSPTDSSSDGASHHTDFEKEQKSSEWTVTRVIISRSPAASSTDRASHHTEFEEEHKCKDVPNPLLADEYHPQTKLESMAEYTDYYFDESLNPLSSFGKSTEAKDKYLPKHPKSRSTSIYERNIEVELKPSVKYSYFKAKYFQRFHYNHKLMRDCHDRIEGLRSTRDQRNLTGDDAEDLIIKIGIVGEYTEDKLNLLLKRKGKRERPPKNQQIWKQSPIICFEKSTKSALRMLRRVEACHKILIISDPNNNEPERVEDSIIIIREDKEQILKTISVCLEEHIHEILQGWSVNLPLEGFGKYLPDIFAEIEDIRKQMLFDDNSHYTTDASAFRDAGNKLIVPSNVKEYLFGRRDVNSFGIWRNSSFKVFVKKTIDANELKTELKKIHQTFFENYNLEIVKGRLVLLNTLKQGNIILRNQDGEKYAGTLGGFVSKTDDEKKIYALTCNHVFPKEELLAYTDNCTDRDIGSCVFTTRDSSCDFAAIEINESFSKNCEVPLRREDTKKTSARVFDESLEQISFVHKIGATTNVTKGRILSSEYYAKDLPTNLFLVKGTGEKFSDQGDSGALVFSRPRSGRQNYINVLGMVFGNNFIKYDNADDSDDDRNVEKNKKLEDSQNKDEERVEPNVEKTTTSNTFASDVADDKNLSCCYRVQPAFDLLKEKKDIDVKFKDDLSTPSSSSDDSNEEAC